MSPAGIAALAGLGVDAVYLSARGTSTSARPSGPGGGPAADDVTDPAVAAAAVERTRSAGA